MSMLLLVWMCGVCVQVRADAYDEEARELVKDMFVHAYDSYMHHAHPHDELRPLSCGARDTYGSYALTLLDSLDALVVMGLTDRLREAVAWTASSISRPWSCTLPSHTWCPVHSADPSVCLPPSPSACISDHHTWFDLDKNVSVFETNIRVLGSLVSTHVLLVEDESLVPEYQGHLLEAAEDLALRLLPAFDTPTGLPFGTVNLRYGVPPGETPVVCTACAGSFSLEFGVLSALTGDSRFREAADRASRALFESRSEIGLLGAHIDAETGMWTHVQAGVGNYIDSYLEYLVKSYVAFGDEHAWRMFDELYQSMEGILRNPPYWVTAHTLDGHHYHPRLDSLQAFWPGVLTLAGRLPEATENLYGILGVALKSDMLLPESFDLLAGTVESGREGYPLRPELAESLYHVWRATSSPNWTLFAARMVRSLNSTCRVPCGLAAVRDVSTGQLEDRMDSFVLSETLKYLYLSFDHDNFVNRGNYIFTTEGHVIDVHAVRSLLRRTRPNRSAPSESYSPHASAMCHVSASAQPSSCPNRSWSLFVP